MFVQLFFKPIFKNKLHFSAQKHNIIYFKKINKRQECIE